MISNYNLLRRPLTPANEIQRTTWRRIHLDLSLLMAILSLAVAGLFILYSAGGESLRLLTQQGIRIGIGLLLMLVCAQIPPQRYRQWAPWLFTIALLLLLFVLAIGIIGKGAQRWLGVGVLRIQPSELMKLAVPLMLAWYLDNKSLPPNRRVLIISFLILMVPVILIAKQPDLGTALMIALSGICVLILSGMEWRLIVILTLIAAACTPIAWHFMHGYQHERVLTFLHPERDPLGAGYHIIQSKIAIGSGGLLGKGWLNGTQSHLQFLPEHATDFIFAVCGEEFGLIGSLILITLFLVIVGRILVVSAQAQDTFSRLLAGGLGLIFFFSAFVNIGMVMGILPVVGLPLPLVSYGGSSVVTLLASFGIIMSIHTHRKLLAG